MLNQLPVRIHVELFADGAGFGNAGSWNDINGSNLLFYIVEMSPLVDNSASSSVENSIINGRQYLSNEVQSLSRQENIEESQFSAVIFIIAYV